MSNYFITVKMGRWLFTLGVLFCLGIVLLSRVLSRNREFSSAVSVFWVGISPFFLPQSLNAPSVLPVEPNATATSFSAEHLFFQNNEQLSKASGALGVIFSSATPAVGYLPHKGIGALNSKPSPVGTSVNRYSYASQKDTFSDGCFSQAMINNAANGSFISTEVPHQNSNGINKNTNVKSPPSLSLEVPSISSRRGSQKFNKINNDPNIVERAPYNSLNVKLNLSTLTEPVSISGMALLLHKAASTSYTPRPRWSSAPDKQLVSAKQQLQNVPILHNVPRLNASVYRNVSLFRRSYELMENILKVYIYGEGEKPIFHQSIIDGIYASEGWFIKLMEEDKQFTVQDPSAAHLFFLPISLKSLRALFNGKFRSWKSRMLQIDNYVDLISAKYPFWNRTQGTDHFLIACHDWGLRLTAGRTRNCIRALCNANAADGFTIGKDATLPVTFVRKAEEPLRDLGVKLPSKRPILAFFAGSMHGDLRPVLVKYWQNKVPDMIILGSLPRNGQGQKIYRDHMKHSKYCVCARGYEVHTPRIVEAIFQECVPVIIADNYVPPFLEVLIWESFAIFVKEKDVPNLRKILVSIPQHKYRLMQQRVKVIQKHFLWHKNPVPFDLFHMILHSVWYNRLSQMKI